MTIADKGGVCIIHVGDKMTEYVELSESSTVRRRQLERDMDYPITDLLSTPAERLGRRTYYEPSPPRREPRPRLFEHTDPKLDSSTTPNEFLMLGGILGLVVLYYVIFILIHYKHYWFSYFLDYF